MTARLATEANARPEEPRSLSAVEGTPAFEGALSASRRSRADPAGMYLNNNYVVTLSAPHREKRLNIRCKNPLRRRERAVYARYFEER